jgi:GDP-4-dehydro-6-deoxy-D-mannose reductase
VTADLVLLGAQGLLGRVLAARWLGQHRGSRVVGVGRGPRSDDGYPFDVGWRGRRVPAPVPPELVETLRSPRYRYVRCDAADREALAALLARARPAVVVHAAAALRDSPWPQLSRSNIDTVAALLAAAAGQRSPPRLILVSSGSVYGPADPLPFRETEATTPIELYGVSKRAGEDVGRVLAERHGVALVRARVFNLVGPGLQDRHLPAALAGQLAAVRAGAAEPVLRMGPLTSTRDFLDVRDAADALLVLAARGEPGRAYNVASGVETPARDVLDTLLALSGLEGAVRVAHLAGRPVDLPRAVADVSALRALGVPAARPLSEPLAALLDWYDLVAGTEVSSPAGRRGARRSGSPPRPPPPPA